MFKTCSLLPGGYLPEVVAHGVLTVSANSMLWWEGGGGEKVFFFSKEATKDVYSREATNHTKLHA